MIQDAEETFRGTTKKFTQILTPIEASSVKFHIPRSLIIISLHFCIAFQPVGLLYFKKSAKQNSLILRCYFTWISLINRISCVFESH